MPIGAVRVDAVPSLHTTHTHRLAFRPMNTIAPFIWLGKQRAYPVLAMLFVAYTVVTLAFFSYQTTQWYHFLHTLPLLVVVGTELTFCDACASPARIEQT